MGSKQKEQIKDQTLLADVCLRAGVEIIDPLEATRDYDLVALASTCWRLEKGRPTIGRTWLMNTLRYYQSKLREYAEGVEYVRSFFVTSG